MGSALKDLNKLPVEVRTHIGHALNAAQRGERAPSAKALRGFHGSDVLEIVVSDRSGTFRAAYLIRFPEAIVVLHVFQKKSKTGIETPREDMALINRRLKTAIFQLKAIQDEKKSERPH